MNTTHIPDSAQGLIDETFSMADATKKLKGKVTFVINPVKVFGIIFNHAFPLDLSITKYCFQGCPFCFATANKRANQDVIGKTEDPTNHFFRLLQKANGQGYDANNITEYCIRNKYPIIFSNNVDPFMPASEEGFQLGERVLQFCLDHNQPLFIQTKEVYYGEKVKELLIKGKHLFQVYVSLSTIDFEIAKKYETVAVTPETRLSRIRELTDEGVHVIVACNPYVPEWVPNVKEYLAAVKASGASGVFTYPLHLSHSQKKVMPKRFAPFVGKADRYDDFHEDMKIWEVLCEKAGLHLYYPRRHGNPGPYKGSTLFKMPDQVWPIDAHWLMELVYSVYKDEDSPVTLTWADCDKFFSKWDVWSRVFTVNQLAGVMWTDNETYFQVKQTLGSKNSIRNIIRYIWNNPEQQDHFLGFYTDVFQLADSEGMEKGEVAPVTDDNDDLIYVFDPKWKGDPKFYDQSHPLLKDKELVELDFEVTSAPK